MRTTQLMALALLTAWTATSHAEVRNVSAAGFDIVVQREISASKADVFQAIGQVYRWWNSAHTWSGSASNLTLHADSGGCFCERWGNGSAEHGRVVHVESNRALRLRAALGPLQSMPVDAVLTFTLTDNAGKTTLQVTYRVAGANQDLSPLAQPVDAVITEQVERLVRFVATGSAEKN
jgi:uncharacterized protein YndB with AHSA1/START domain